MIPADGRPLSDAERERMFTLIVLFQNWATRPLHWGYMAARAVIGWIAVRLAMLVLGVFGPQALRRLIHSKRFGELRDE
jgi:hypothetical protein